jgi:tetratricopeptide (TPR) repeat protein
MHIIRHPRSWILLSLLPLAAAGSQLIAAGGGMGGGMPSMPSETAPTYDAAAEYRDGVAALGENRFKDAKRNFDHVLAMDSKNANANYLAGMARLGLQDQKGAVRFFEKAIKYDNDLINAHKQYGVTLAALGQKDKAQAELDALKTRASQCGDSCPQAADLKDAIAAIATQLGGAPQARLDLAPGLMFASARGGDQAYLDAVALINEKRYEDAIASLHRAEKAFGPHPDVLTYLGFANRKLKRYDLAEGYYLAALRLAPNHRGATEYYGELMVERGDIAGAKLKLAALDRSCSFGCYEAEELRRWIDSGHGSSS